MSIERSQSFGCYMRRKCREVWEVREVEDYFILDRQENIGGLVAKKILFRSGGLRGRKDEENVWFLSKEKKLFFPLLVRSVTYSVHYRRDRLLSTALLCCNL
jgi:hypothetical protein